MNTAANATTPTGPRTKGDFPKITLAQFIADLMKLQSKVEEEHLNPPKDDGTVTTLRRKADAQK